MHQTHITLGFIKQLVLNAWGIMNDAITKQHRLFFMNFDLFSQEKQKNEKTEMTAININKAIMCVALLQGTDFTITHGFSFKTIRQSS